MARERELVKDGVADIWSVTMRIARIFAVTSVLMLGACGPVQDVLQAVEVFRLRMNLKHSCAPTNPEEAIEFLDSELGFIQKRQIESTRFMDLHEFHFGLGMYMRNWMCLWEGGPLAKWFIQRGVTEVDDMSGYLIELYWAHRMGCSYDADRFVRHWRNVDSIKCPARVASKSPIQRPPYYEALMEAVERGRELSKSDYYSNHDEQLPVQKDSIDSNVN